MVCEIVLIVWLALTPSFVVESVEPPACGIGLSVYYNVRDGYLYFIGMDPKGHEFSRKVNIRRYTRKKQFFGTWQLTWYQAHIDDEAKEVVMVRVTERTRYGGPYDRHRETCEMSCRCFPYCTAERVRGAELRVQAAHPG